MIFSNYGARFFPVAEHEKVIKSSIVPPEVGFDRVLLGKVFCSPLGEPGEIVEDILIFSIQFLFYCHLERALRRRLHDNACFGAPFKAVPVLRLFRQIAGGI